MLYRVKCDLPVHCKREAIDGLWNFYINHSVFQPSLKNPETSCGHGFPDRIETTVGDIDFKFDKTSELKIKLASDYKVYKDDIVIGNWTPVYDEGFILYYKNSVFTAFMKYYRENDKDTKDSNYISNCSKTMIGWYTPDVNNNNKNWSCFYGIKEIPLISSSRVNSDINNKLKNNFIEKTELQLDIPLVPLIPNLSNLDNYNIYDHYYHYDALIKKKNTNLKSIFNTIKSKNSGFVEVAEKVNLDNKINSEIVSMMTMEEKNSLKYEDQRELINEINSMNLGWKAEIHEEFKGLSLLELSENLGLNKSKKNRIKNHKNHSNHS